MTGDGNWTWLIRGRVPTLIDAGTGDAGHLDAVQRDLQGAGLAQVLVTHAHGDHASGAPALAQRFPGVHFRKMPWPERDDTWPVGWEPIADGDTIDVGDTSLVALHTPGHAPDHLCFWHEETRTLFGGDLALRGSTVWIPAHLRGDLSDYLASLTRMLALGPARILPAHGAVIEDPERLLRRYLAHRREREEQVIDALRAGDSTPEEIVARVYDGLKGSLVNFAMHGIVAHLVKLERDGKARSEGGAWRLIDT